MILKIFDEKEHAWLFYDKIEKFRIVYPDEMQYYLGELEFKDDEPKSDTTYFYDEKNHRKLIVRIGPSPDYDRGYFFGGDIDRFFGCIEEIEMYERLGMIQFWQNGKENLTKTFIFGGYLAAYLLNDEGKTVEKL